jgi:Sec-independent protein translocase protein TatA
MFGLGVGEFVVILVVVALILNRRLPDLGASFGAAVRKFKKALHEPEEIDITPADEGTKGQDKK